MNTLTLTDTGETISFISASVSGNLDNFSFDAQIELESLLLYRRLKPRPGAYTPIQLNIFGIIFALLVETGNRSWSVDDNGVRTESFTVSARSRAALLDDPHSLAIVTKIWTKTTAKTIVQELCDAKAVVLDWTIPDWPIRTYSAINMLPINIIVELVGEKGTMAIVQPTLDGKLSVCLRDKLSPAKYSEYVPDHSLTDDDNLFALSETFVERGKYGWIEISNEAVSINSQITFETVEEANGIIIKAFVVPFKAITLQHSGLSFVDAVYEGVFTEAVVEDIVLIDGLGNVAKPCYGLLSAIWFYQDLGSLVISEQGNIIADIVGHSLVTVTYQTKYHRYRAMPTGAKKVLAYTETL